MQSLVKILPNGAILIGKRFTIDGHHERPFRVVTHFHADHITGLEKSISISDGIIATPITLDILSLDYAIPPRKAFGLNYDIKMTFEDENIVLKKSDHVIGSAQVLITLENGLEIGYTGDFKNPGKGTPILHPDILIIEATYGRPDFRRPFKDDVESLFADYVRDALMYGPVRIYGYHGKLQEVMISLRKMGVDAPFIVGGKISKMTNIAIKYGYNISQVFDESQSEAKEIMRDSWYISFSHYNEFKRRNGKYYNFLLSGWEFKNVVKKIDEKSYTVSFSDHADFDDLIYYVERTSAKYIITDGGRRSYGKELAEYISKKLGKIAISMP
ncbi:MBL fold metallo-hydrolase [Saccharolobus solfataricus]|uniref:Zn-dependent metallo-hydrolase RNA specificity domain-containing protein n=3 Tax=Saccharolobus solfataricus TaxID=2287 RepID=Q980T9_SACS2|nr:MBL fold metallo-hydrolase [Saccharolobus solfataricus]AAK40534.1 Conserved hypothetical protein [Saccharolobus solfataricus P2]AKA73514.1 MBL fold metallo-hydrolase [Saccharolobus solfataricus]AKA76212.1 MBL fold metallo-hydrolase [Saccharolobus solfataricus]AKA78904.1 MBL fold metallo-hydrolase [Saccharolobus solfataricus]AZF67983.1 MBL fold metallo-hydrolase [Saccharolobus solfataricus]